ncbi:MAG TPA: hypothetical protein VEB65_06920 [Solirubrobacterales bacterium]|nr:hypothetical protein [Solirubrobacterales bacterium]
MTVPAEASEIEDFTPPSLLNLPSPPVFKLRPATGREWRKYQYIMRAEGLTYHSTDDIRAEMLRALEALYSPDDCTAAMARLRSLWALVDQKGQPDEAEAIAVHDLLGRLTREWSPLARAGADNMRFLEEASSIAVSMFLVGWTGLDLSYRRTDGRVPLDLIDELEDALQRLERQAVEDKVEGVGKPGTAFDELCSAAHSRLSLTREEEKNSSSPPSIPSGRNGSKTRPSRRAGSSSKTSASSDQAPAA